MRRRPVLAAISGELPRIQGSNQAPKHQSCGRNSHDGMLAEHPKQPRVRTQDCTIALSEPDTTSRDVVVPDAPRKNEPEP